MADLNIPNLNKKSDKYIFKKKLSLRRKSKRKLFIESALMFILGLLLVFINYLIPEKNLLLSNLPKNLNESFLLIIDLLYPELLIILKTSAYTTFSLFAYYPVLPVKVIQFTSLR